MKQRRHVVALWSASLAVLPVGAHAEREIFKCTKPDGSTVFSPTPCSKSATAIQVPRSDKAAAPQNDAIRDISDSVADSHCRDDAHKLYIEPDTSAIVRADREMREIQGRTWVGGSAANRQLMAANDETHIASLRGLIATEQARAEAVRKESRARVDAALLQCDKLKSEREAAKGK